jgi:geranylgeranyl pyrophosphate synthase
MQMRPYIVTIMGRACRSSLPDPSCESSKWPDQIEMNQNQIAKITEMIHTASLVHDDVLDEATTRRNKTAVNVAFTAKECVLAGDAILAKATYMLAEIGNVRVIEIFSQVGPSPATLHMARHGAAAQWIRHVARVALLFCQQCH